MTDNTSPGLGRVLVIGVLLMATLGFGLASLCGAAFTLMALPDVLSSRSGSYADAALVIAVPSLLIGGGLAWLCGRGLYRFMRRHKA